MKLLAIDSATDGCSAAVLVDGKVYERYAQEARAQSTLLLPMVDAVLTEAGISLQDLDALAVGCGPGSFTGVRLAIGVAQGLALGADLPVIAVSDLAMLAQGVAAEYACPHSLVCVDARMDEVYWCAFERTESGLVTPLHAERLGSPESVVPPAVAPFVGIGSGWARYEPQLRMRLAATLVACAPARVPHARDALALAVPLWLAGRAVPAQAVMPVYLRDQVATRPGG